MARSPFMRANAVRAVRDTGIEPLTFDCDGFESVTGTIWLVLPATALLAAPAAAASAALTEGSVIAFGDNQYGQFGNTTNINTEVPFDRGAV
jgi:hypothetical protein